MATTAIDLRIPSAEIHPWKSFGGERPVWRMGRVWHSIKGETWIADWGGEMKGNIWVHQRPTES